MLPLLFTIAPINIMLTSFLWLLLLLLILLLQFKYIMAGMSAVGLKENVRVQVTGVCAQGSRVAALSPPLPPGLLYKQAELLTATP